MTDLICKQFEGKDIRITDKDGEPWFIARDVCDVLDIQNVSDACSRLDEDEKLISLLPISGQGREILIVNESGLYNLIFQSRKPEAKAFKRWVTHEVIPSIRKTGQYNLSSSCEVTTKSEEDQIISKAMQIMDARIKELKPKADYYDKYMSSDGLKSIGDYAKAMGWGRNRLFAYLKNIKIFMINNLPYQGFIDSGYFEVKEIVKNGFNLSQTFITPKGEEYIEKKINKQRQIEAKI